MGLIKQNLLYNIAYQLLVLFLPLITAPYISRVLGAKGLGIYSYTYSVATTFALFAMLGMANHGNRTIAMSRTDRETLSRSFWNLYAIQVISSVLVLVCYGVYMILLAGSEAAVNSAAATGSAVAHNSGATIGLIQALIPISAMLDISWFYFGMESFKVTVGRNALIKALTMGSIFLFVKSSEDLWKYALIMSAGTVASQIILWAFVKRHITFVRPHFREMKRHLLPVVTLFLPVLAYSVYRLLDKIMLGQMSTMTQIGYFDNGEKIINVPMSVIVAFGTVMLPRSSYLVSTDNRELQLKYMGKSMNYISLLAFGFAFGLAGISGTLAIIYFGSGFAESGVLIGMLAPTIVFASWAGVIRTQYIIPLRLDRIYVNSMILAAVLNFLLNLVFIPRLGGRGAVLGTLAAEFAVMAGQSLALWRKVPLLQFLRPSIAYLFVGVAEYLAIIGVRMQLGTSLRSLLWQIGAGAGIYGIGAALFLYYKKDEMALSVGEKIRRIFRLIYR